MKNRRVVSLLFVLSLIFPIHVVHGHGWGLDTASVNFEGRDITVTFELPQYFDPTKDKTISISAFDEEAEENVKNVTFLIGLFHEDKMIFRNYFFTQDGNLIINVKPTQEEKTRIIAEKEPLLGAYHKTESQPIELVGPVFTDGGLYHFEVEIRTIDEPTNIVEDFDTFVADVSIAETTSHPQKTKDGDEVTFRMKSYFDKISSFEYDPHENVVNFTIPFDWSEQVISHIPVVHEEVHFPKDFADFLYPSYIGKVNGVELFKSNVIIDDFTEEDERIVHFVILQDHLQFLKQQQKKMDEELPDHMMFTLEVSEKIQFPMTAMTRDERFQIDLSWEPVQIEPEKTTKFVFTIRDANTGETLRNSSYEFVILQNNVEIYRATGNAQIGGGFEEFTFTEGQTGPTLIRFENIRGSGLDTEFGLVVVPEFGMLSVLIFSLAMIFTLAVNKKLSIREFVPLHK